MQDIVRGCSMHIDEGTNGKYWTSEKLQTCEKFPWTFKVNLFVSEQATVLEESIGNMYL